MHLSPSRKRVNCLVLPDRPARHFACTIDTRWAVTITVFTVG